jgi:hypothetical protein
MLQFYCYNLNILLYKEIIYYNQVNYIHFKKLYMRQRKRIKNYILDIKKKDEKLVGKYYNFKIDWLKMIEYDH